jgi:hypothetical protein
LRAVFNQLSPRITLANATQLPVVELRGISNAPNDGPRRVSGEPKMSDLVVIAFPTEAKAEEVRQKLLAMQKVRPKRRRPKGGLTLEPVFVANVARARTIGKRLDRVAIIEL